jgi:hypothetical protein
MARRNEQYITDTNGKQIGVILPMAEYKRLLAQQKRTISKRNRKTRRGMKLTGTNNTNMLKGNPNIDIQEFAGDWKSRKIKSGVDYVNKLRKDFSKRN